MPDDTRTLVERLYEALSVELFKCEQDDPTTAETDWHKKCWALVKEAKEAVAHAR